ncbi:protein of unknown function [Actinokineospora alba]|uniref:DUF4288 domain-containing protein n=1 Tax=Actinokineospora alba TaxID=504798 RepID=A0A1H0F3R9_9PSEU|nr:DUF4288 domain-containing protein [Actinokineospora alba]TDP69325.1 uncharacterized protein DUF4288 [Actinokineospora alba]SDI19219.1 protein of unknown function [Actinokineospora alba]SDN89196.1 protein of unknown function [Actinokineospora alba]
MVTEKPFVAVVLYESTCDSPDYQTLYREDVVLVYARTEDEAREAVRVRAAGEAGSHRNELGEVITLSVKEVLDVAPALDEDLTRGGDLYSRHFTNFDAYRRFEPLLSEKD